MTWFGVWTDDKIACWGHWFTSTSQELKEPS